MNKLLFIAGRDHSGSTLLELLLSSHPRVFGLGETHMLVDDRLRAERLPQADVRICTCGRPLSGCPLWGAFLEHAERNPDGDFASRYRLLVQLAEKEFGHDPTLIDSSKYVEPLARLLEAIRSGELPDLELFVVHLVKDVRAFAASMKRRYGLKSRQLPAQFERWYRSNRELERFLEGHGVAHVRVGYEELCFNPPLVLSMICKEAGLPFDEAMLDPSRATAHIGVGNPMRNHATKSAQVIYDNRWFFETDIQLWYLLRRRIRRYNEAAAYGNLHADRTARLFEPRSG